MNVVLIVLCDYTWELYQRMNMKLKKLTQILKFSLHILKKIMSLICQVLIQLFDGNIHTYSRNLTDFEAFCEWNCEWIIFPLIVLKYLWMEIWSFIVLLWDSYSQVLWNSDWMQVQSMGTHCQVSSQLIKKTHNFLREIPPSAGIEPGTSCVLDQHLTDYAI